MRRPSKTSTNKLSTESQRLVHLAQGITQASSRLEERSWEATLDAQLHKLLKTGHQDTLDAALDHLFRSDLAAYDTLMEAIEAGSESCTIEHEGEHYDALLIAAPALAWTRFTIASGPIPQDMRDTLAAHLHAHLLAEHARLALAPTLYAIDQLPRTHTETLALTQRMAQAALKNSAPRPLTNTPETAPFLADTRYLLAAAVVRRGEPLFRWQESMDIRERERGFEQWRAQAAPTMMRLLPGCNIDLLLPEAYYVACREADKLIRPASIRAAVHYLAYTLNVVPQDLRAIIGGFAEEPLNGRIDEYRIGFALRHEPEIVYGVVWPLYGEEDKGAVDATTLVDALSAEDLDEPGPRTAIAEILALLNECGLVHIKRHTEHFPMEFCDDCGAPLYPDPEGELVHAEMPEDAPSGSGHFH